MANLYIAVSVVGCASRSFCKEGRIHQRIRAAQEINGPGYLMIYTSIPVPVDAVRITTIEVDLANRVVWERAANVGVV